MGSYSHLKLKLGFALSLFTIFAVHVLYAQAPVPSQRGSATQSQSQSPAGDANAKAPSPAGDIETPGTIPEDATTNPGAAGVDSPNWVFPMEQFNEGVLPAWFHFGGELRERADSYQGIGFENSRDTHDLQRFRLNATVDAGKWLHLFAEVQDARVFLNGPVASTNNVQDTWTLWQSYVQIGSTSRGWGDVLIGREVLRFGDERVIGPSDWTNVSRTFNVARLDLRHGQSGVSIFGASVVPAGTDELHGARQGNNLYGVYTSFGSAIPKALIEPYVFWRVAPASSALAEEVGHGRLNEVTAGLHIKGKLPSGFDYNTEFDGQTGSLGTFSILAWAGYAELGKTFSGVRTQPHIFVEGNYASGTKNATTGHSWNTFDQIYPSNHDKYGFTDQFGRRNLEEYRIAAEAKLTKNWTFRLAEEGFWLATANDNAYNGAGSILAAARPGTSRHLADELDFVNEVKIYRGLHTGFGYARTFTRAFLNRTTGGKDFSYPYAFVEYTFDDRSGGH
jgi:hypothetical protein